MKTCQENLPFTIVSKLCPTVNVLIKNSWFIKKKKKKKILGFGFIVNYFLDKTLQVP